MATTDVSTQDRFFLRQRIRVMINQYEVSTLGADGKSERRPPLLRANAGGNLVATALERNLVVALFRRLVGFIPCIGALAAAERRIDRRVALALAVGMDALQVR
jgi:hypothetical protein